MARVVVADSRISAVRRNSLGKKPFPPNDQNLFREGVSQIRCRYRREGQMKQFAMAGRRMIAHLFFLAPAAVAAQQQALPPSTALPMPEFHEVFHLL